MNHGNEEGALERGQGGHGTMKTGKMKRGGSWKGFGMVRRAIQRKGGRKYE